VVQTIAAVPCAAALTTRQVSQAAGDLPGGLL